MINTIDDLIEHLETIKKEKGNLFIRTQIQVGKIIDVDTFIEVFYNHDKSVNIEALIIKGYLTKPI